MTRLIEGSYGAAMDIPQHNMLGLPALVAELQEQGIDPLGLLEGTELSPAQMLNPASRISHPQRRVVFANMHRLMLHSDSGLRAGARQRLSDFGILGYALVSSNSFGEAVEFGIRHIRLLGPIFQKSFRIEGDEGVFVGQGFFSLGEMMPLATEFWFASIHSLVQCVLENPLPSRRLLLPYPPPDHWQCYEAFFNCPVEFDSPVMEWRFDASVLQLPCPNANPITLGMGVAFCQQLMAKLPDESDLIESVRTVCLTRNGRFPGVEMVACSLGMSARTLHRRLAEYNRTYQSILDEVRCALAIEFLKHSDLPIDDLAVQVGFSEAANFRKAFRKWTGRSPGEFRKATRNTP